MLCTLFSNLVMFFKIATIVTRCIDAFLDAKNATKIDFGDEFIVVSYLSKINNKKKMKKGKNVWCGLQKWRLVNCALIQEDKN